MQGVSLSLPQTGGKAIQSTRHQKTSVDKTKKEEKQKKGKAQISRSLQKWQRRGRESRTLLGESTTTESPCLLCDSRKMKFLLAHFNQSGSIAVQLTYKWGAK